MSEVTFRLFGVEIHLLLLVCIAAAIGGLWLMFRAIRNRGKGSISHSVYRAEVVLGASYIAGLPLLIIAVRVAGYWLGLVLAFVWLGVGIWAHETSKDTDTEA